MKEDYLLISVDPQSQVAIRLMNLKHTIAESIKLHRIENKTLQKVLAEHILGAVILGSRNDEQQSILFKLQLSNYPISINCEVSPNGLFRSAVFPPENSDKIGDDFKGTLKVVTLKKGNETYQSIINIEEGSVLETYRKYIKRSVQSQSKFFLNTDLEIYDNNFALWMEKLPDTENKDWKSFIKPFNKKDFFVNSFSSTTDPDQIVNNLFPGTIKILAVTKPRLYCSCSKERILESLKLLPNEQLVEIYMDKAGVETLCDYCHRVWKIEDKEIQELIKMSGSVH